MKHSVSIAVVFALLVHAGIATAQERRVGGIEENNAGAAKAPRPVRNDAAQPGDEIVTLRYFKIQKGAFPEFVRESREGVWPYFEKIGSRVVGMWKVIHPDDVAGESPDFDEVYLMTRYASYAHWKASRRMADHGGNGPDWERCWEALRRRRALTIETHVQVLQGLKWDNPPWFMPGLEERYERVEP